MIFRAIIIQQNENIFRKIVQKYIILNIYENRKLILYSRL